MKMKTFTSIKTIDGNLALKEPDYNTKIKDNQYQSPKIKKLVKKNNNHKIVMGCWEQSYSANDGDGC